MPDLVAGLLTALGSGVTAALATYSFNSNKDHVFLLRQKAEDLHISFQRFSLTVSNYAFVNMRLARGELNLQAIYDINKERSVDEDSAKKVSMLVNIYFPSLLPHHGNFLGRLARLNRIVEKIEDVARDAGGRMERDNELLSQINQEAKLLHDVSAKFGAAISEEGRKIASQDALLPRIWVRLGDRIRRNRSAPFE